MEISPPLATLAGALSWGAAQLVDASPTARLDAALLLAEVLGWPRARVLAERDAPLTPAQAARYAALVARRAALEPVAYLIGRREFYGLMLSCDARALVPRPETELLVDLALGLARARAPQGAGLQIADIGTGTGCIAAALASHLARAQIIATDISPDALALARANLAQLGLGERVELRQGDLLSPLAAPVDLIVSNPPYTIMAEIDEGVRRHEPALALDGGPDGLQLYRRLLAAAPAALRPGGALLLEIGAWQGESLRQLARAALPGAQVAIHQDLAGRDRVAVIV